MNEKETMEAPLHRVIDEKEALLAEREQLLEALEAALFALCTVETTECAAARYRARAAIAKARGEALDIKANNQAVRIEELERALADIENYYAQHYREGEVGYQAVLIARNVKR